VQPLDLLGAFLAPLERAGFPYMVTGSVAAIFYGVPRVTHDVDLVLDIPAAQAEAFAGFFPSSEFYCPPVEILVTELSRPARSHFNLIHHASGFKADIYPSRDWLHRWGMERRVRFDQAGFSAWVAPVEYVIVRKLEYFGEGGSEKHLSDIQKILAVEGDIVDKDWIRARAEERGLREAWDRASGRR
jgi:hypothetical protein